MPRPISNDHSDCFISSLSDIDNMRSKCLIKRRGGRIWQWRHVARLSSHRPAGADILALAVDDADIEPGAMLMKSRPGASVSL